MREGRGAGGDPGFRLLSCLLWESNPLVTGLANTTVARSKASPSPPGIPSVMTPLRRLPASQGGNANSAEP